METPVLVLLNDNPGTQSEDGVMEGNSECLLKTPGKQHNNLLFHQQHGILGMCLTLPGVGEFTSDYSL